MFPDWLVERKLKTAQPCYILLKISFFALPYEIIVASPSPCHRFFGGFESLWGRRQNEKVASLCFTSSNLAVMLRKQFEFSSTYWTRTPYLNVPRVDDSRNFRSENFSLEDHVRSDGYRRLTTMSWRCHSKNIHKRNCWRAKRGTRGRRRALEGQWKSEKKLDK